MSYDYSDSTVATLVATTHIPVEATDSRSPAIPAPQLFNLMCEKCYNPWPCSTITDYRAATRLVSPPSLGPLNGPPPRGR